MQRTHRCLSPTDIIQVGANSSTKESTDYVQFMITTRLAAQGGETGLHARRWSLVYQESTLPSPKTSGVSDQAQLLFEEENITEG